MELSLENISKRYGEKIAVDGVSAKLTPGLHALLGANGAGKTTLMRMLCGILEPTGGRVCCDGRDIAALGGSYRDILGYLPQDFGYYPLYSGEEFLLYIAALKGLPRVLAKQRVVELLETVGLTAAADKKVKTYSGGMKQRLGIAQALLNKPRVIILDEPTAGLDPKERVRFRNLLSDLANDRIVLLSTHIVSDIQSVADNVLLMRDGRIMFDGDTDALVSQGCGRVWELPVSEIDIPEYETRFTVANIRRDGGHIYLRLISDECPGPDAALCPPSLEDVYLYYFPANKE